MKILSRLLPLCLCLSLSGCATLLGWANGPQPIQENPRERTFGTVLDDQMIEAKVLHNITHAAPELARAHLVVTSYNGVVLLAGQVESQALKQKAAEVARKVRKVRLIHNELQVAKPTSLMVRNNDAWITTKAKTQMMLDPELDSDYVKVITENSVVYLMGLVSRQEAEQAVNIARQIRGVQKIVKVFEYID